LAVPVVRGAVLVGPIETLRVVRLVVGVDDDCWFWLSVWLACSAPGETEIVAG
jgi:hypothetical protein